MKYLILFMLVILMITSGVSQTWVFKEDTKRYALQVNEISLLDSVRFYASQDNYEEFFGTTYVVNDQFISYWKVPNRPDGIYYVYADMYYNAITVKSETRPMYWAVDADTLGRSFTTRVQIPSQVGLIDPPGGAINVSVDINLVWGDTPYANFYQLQLSTHPFYETTIIDVVVEGTTFYVEGLQHNTTYYWRVRAGNDSGWGMWSGN